MQPPASHVLRHALAHPKPCVTCRHFRSWAPDYDQNGDCLRFVQDTHPVSGKAICRPALEVRNDPMQCGLAGRYWEGAN